MFSSSNTRAFQPFASNSVRRPVAIPRVARPHHHHHHHYHTSSFSYTDLVVSYERVITDSKDTNSAAASQQYLSDPAVHGNPKIMARQIQHTLGQVVSAGRHAVEEVAAALDPKQRSDSSSNTAKSRPKPLKAVGKQAARLGQAIAHDVHAATQVSACLLLLLSLAGCGRLAQQGMQSHSRLDFEELITAFPLPQRATLCLLHRRPTTTTAPTSQPQVCGW